MACMFAVDTILDNSNTKFLSNEVSDPKLRLIVSANLAISYI